MGYEIKTLEASLAGYVFEINGAIALRNYTAQVDGDRITITSANNSALSILECDVSEVVIDGITYDNPVDAQNALRSIIYNDLPIVVLTTEEKQKLILKVAETHPDAKKLFHCDGSVVDFPQVDFQVGGRNYLLNSDRFIEVVEGESYKHIYLKITKLQKLRNKTITMSYEYEKTADFHEGDGVCGFYSEILYVDGTIQNISDRFKVTNAIKLKGRVSNTITVLDKAIDRFRTINGLGFREFSLKCTGGELSGSGSGRVGG